MNLKKITILALALVMVFTLAACGGTTTTETKPAETTPAETTPADTTATSDFDTSNMINVVSREEGSGTRGAFVEITGVLGKDASGNEVDNTTIEAVIQNGTNGVMTTVAGDEYGIGYISLGSLNDTVKAVKVEGAVANAEDVKAGTYKVARPFNVAWKEDVIGEIGTDIMTFIMSEEGQAIVEENKYVSAGNDGAYTPANLTGQITIAGSTSVTPLMEKLTEAYKAHNPNVTIDIQSTGSSAGMTSAIEGAAQLGMASRDLKDSETAELTHKAIAIDGIAVIVNNANPLEELSMEQIKSIFNGETTEWSGVIQ